MKVKKYLPIRIFSIHYAYGWWLGEYFFFFGKHSTAFANIPSYRHCVFSSYENGKRIGHGECYSWSDERQREKQEDKERARR